jgi:hypothetical protein
MNQTGHRSVNTVRRYIRDGSLFRENAAAVLGLRPNWPQSVPIQLPVREPATEVHAIARAITQSSCWPEGAP